MMHIVKPLVSSSQDFVIKRLTQHNNYDIVLVTAMKVKLSRVLLPPCMMLRLISSQRDCSWVTNDSSSIGEFGSSCSVPGASAKSKGYRYPGMRNWMMPIWFASEIENQSLTVGF